MSGQSREDVSLWKVSSRGVMFSQQHSVAAVLGMINIILLLTHNSVVARFCSDPM